MNRAFHVGGLVWLAASFLIAATGFPTLAGAVLGAVVLAGMLLCGKKLPLWAYASATAFCFCMLSFTVYDGLVLAPAAQYSGTVQEVCGTVTDKIANSGYATIELITDRTNPAGLRGTRIRLTLHNGLDVDAGDVIKCNVRLTDDGDAHTRLYAKDIRFQGNVYGAVTRVGSDPHNPRVLLAHYRAQLEKGITRNLTGVEGDVLKGLVLGRTERISPALRYAYARAGISHVLAVSGLHLAILVGLLDCLLRNLFLSRRERALISIAAVLAFMAMTGFSHSVVRAGVMSILCLSAVLLGRDADTLNSLGFALILILLLNPYAAFSLSLQLSYFATMGIAAFATPLTGWMGRKLTGKSIFQLEEFRKGLFTLLQSVSTTFCATVLTLPIVCWEFGQVSLVAPVVNFMLAPVIASALSSGLLCALAGLFPPLSHAARTLALGGGVSVQRINETALWWSDLPFAAISVRSDYIIFWMCAVLFLGALLWTARADRPLKLYAASLSVVVLLAGACANTVALGNTIDVAVAENGGTVVLAYGKQGAVLGAPSSIYAAREVESFLLDRGVETISLLVVPRDEQLYSDPVTRLTQNIPTATAFGMDSTNGFTAQLFGQATIRAEGWNATHLYIEAGGLRIAKAFEMRALPADVLINARNEIICAPGVELHINDRYFSRSVFALRHIEKEPL